MFNDVPVSLAHGTASPRSAESAADHDAVPGVSENLDFDDPEAVDEELRRLTEAPVLAALFDLAFDGVDPAAVRDARATLVLYRCADERHQTSTDGIRTRREEALRTLAARLSPTGQETLLPSFRATSQGNPFSQCLAESDRFCLAGHVYRTRAAAFDVSAPYDAAIATGLTREEALAQFTPNLSVREAVLMKAVEAYQAAIVAYPLAGPPEQTKFAYAELARTHEMIAENRKFADLPLQAGQALEKAVEAYTQADLDKQATKAARKAVALYVKAGVPEQAKRVFQMAVDSFRRYRPERTAAAYGLAPACTPLQPVEADAYARAATGYELARSKRSQQIYGGAADAQGQVAEALLWDNEYAEAAAAVSARLYRPR